MKANLPIMFVYMQFALVAVPASVIFEDCAGSAYELRTVHIDGCGMRLPCYVTLGENVPVSLEFVASNFLSRKIGQDVVININHINLKTQVIPERCGIEDCPVSMDAVSSFNSIMSVPTSMALNQRGYLRWRVETEEGLQVLCYSVLVQTQSRAQKMLRQFMKDMTAAMRDRR